jgi:hypothetical protein
MIRVQLSDEAIANARALGMTRHRESIRLGLKDAHGAVTNEIESVRLHCYGALGEFAVASYLELPEPDTVNTFHAPDLAHRVQVRTRLRVSYGLIVRKVDDDDDVFVLVYVEPLKPPAAYVRGWIIGRDAKRPKYLAQHGGRPVAYFVPAEELQPMETLDAYIRPTRRDPSSICADDINWG